MSVSLRNVGNRPFGCDLIHEIYCKGSGKCSCIKIEAKSGAYDGDGFRKMSVRVMNLPKGLHVAVGTEVKGLHESVLNLPIVKRAVQAGVLVSLVEGERLTPNTAKSLKAEISGRGARSKRTS